MNREQEIGLMLRVLSTQPADEEIFHLENEDVNPWQVEPEPEEKPEQESTQPKCPLYPPIEERSLKSVATTKKNTWDRFCHPL
jgi:hypothetical protein